MKITPYDINKLGTMKGYAKSDNLRLLEEFVNSDLDCVKIEDYPHKRAAGCYTSFYSAIKRYNMTGVKVCTRGEDVFLVKVKPE